MIRKAVLILTLVLLPGALAAQDERAPETPDYSKERLLHILSAEIEREEVEPRVQFHVGAIDFRAAGARWRIGYLPFMVPLPGSMPWVNEYRYADPFLLTNTEIASPPRTWRTNRARNAELRRIERLTRESATVTVKPE
jgi:hypothetical protein